MHHNTGMRHVGNARKADARTTKDPALSSQAHRMIAVKLPLPIDTGPLRKLSTGINTSILPAGCATHHLDSIGMTAVTQGISTTLTVPCSMMSSGSVANHTGPRILESPLKLCDSAQRATTVFRQQCVCPVGQRREGLHKTALWNPFRAAL